jgi:hypothetical protein
MDPNVWGKHGWIFLHSVTMAYPEKPTEMDKQNYKSFFDLVSIVLPCDVCRKNLRQHMSEIPIKNALSNKKGLVQWLINIHNKTNESLGKPILTYSNVIDIYKKMYNENEVKHEQKIQESVKNENNYYTLIAIILGIIIISLFIWKKKSVLFV